eukprot:1437734-Rhodomonas_salina.1
MSRVRTGVGEELRELEEAVQAAAEMMQVCKRAETDRAVSQQTGVSACAKTGWRERECKVTVSTYARSQPGIAG